VQRISAVTLATADMRAAVRFYTAVGFEVTRGGESAAFTTFRVGDAHLNLIAEPDHRPAFWGRIIFHVANVDDLYRHLVAQQIRPDTSPADAAWGERYFHVTDPDGHQVSFARPLEH